MPEGHRLGDLHVGVPAPARAPRAVGVIGHQVRPDAPAVELGGLRVSPAVAAWVECSGILSVDDLVVMGDGLVKRWSPPAQRDDLTRAVEAAAGRRGLARLRAALPLIRPGTDSARETLLRLLLVRAGLPEPELNAPIVNRFGAVIAHGDLVYRRQRVVIEYEGAGHLTEKQLAIDIRRLDGVMEEHWRVIRVDKHLMAAEATLVGKVRTALSGSR